MTEPLLRKVCTLCKRSLTILHFPKAKSGKFGVGSWCRVCWRKKNAKRRPTKNGDRFGVGKNSLERRPMDRAHRLRVVRNRQKFLEDQAAIQRWAEQGFSSETDTTEGGEVDAT